MAVQDVERTEQVEAFVGTLASPCREGRRAGDGVPPCTVQVCQWLLDRCSSGWLGSHAVGHQVLCGGRLLGGGGLWVLGEKCSRPGRASLS